MLLFQKPSQFVLLTTFNNPQRCEFVTEIPLTLGEEHTPADSSLCNFTCDASVSWDIIPVKEGRGKVTQPVLQQGSLHVAPWALLHRQALEAAWWGSA